MNINIYLALKILLKAKKLRVFFFRDIFKTRTLHKSPTQSDEMSIQKSDESISQNEVNIKYFFSILS